MSETVNPVRVRCARSRPRLLGIFESWRLLAYGYTLAALYAAFALCLYWLGFWLLSSSNMPVYQDFTNLFVAVWQALHGQTASIYVPEEFLKAQDALVGAGHSHFSTWPYPPTYFLILAPLALLPYAAAFLTYEFATLLGCIAVVYLIVRRQPAIALVLASPFTAWNFLVGQSGFLTAALVGASLLALERRPVLAGILLGCLSFKPQWGILFPVALAAAKQWRAFASAALSAVVLAGISAAAFGVESWAAFPLQLSAEADETLIAASDDRWGYLQTVYGLVRVVDGGAAPAWLAQLAATLGTATIVWFVWRSRTDYSLKAATLSAAIFIATPRAFAYDLAGIAIPVAFLARDQISCGLLRGEQAILIALFIASLSVILTGGRAPVGVLILLTLLFLILRRVVREETSIRYLSARGIPGCGSQHGCRSVC
jgi:arabinofuranan 3-O-arabinosyltransferase